MSTLVEISQAHKPQRFLRQYELVDLVKKYDPSADEALLNKAYVYSVQAHGQQLRHSGDPYYAHPIEVAGIVASLHLDVATICTALLHDVLEDTDVTVEELAKEFTPEIAELVDGVTKLGQVEMSRPNLSRESAQAENFQKFILAVSKDVRVLLVKLCDRLHNMRTLEFHPKQSSRERIARETLEIFAPLARRIGVDKICSELEDLSFCHINPAAYESIEKRLEVWRSTQGEAISQVFTALKDVLAAGGVEARVYGREKRAYAIWRKLQRQNISFDDVADIYAFRIIVERRETCYQVLGVLHGAFRAMPARFRDFISVPKPNGYQSLHTTIQTSENRRVEIQIRTERMEDVAVRGVAAHWAYKDESYGYDPDRANASGGDPLKRIRPLVEMMEHSGNADEFLDNVKLEMFTDQVFTFTPKGDLIALPRGASPIDFAYAVHTKVGDTCIGAIVNGREVPLRTRLENGDVVKVIRGGAPEPQHGWENIAITGRARQALRRLTRTGESEEFRRIGETLALHAFKREGKSLDVAILTDALKRLKITDEATLYETLGRGELSMNRFIEAVFPGQSTAKREGGVQDLDLIDDESAALYIKGDGLNPGHGLHLAPCCSPLPGDRIIGLQEAGRGIDIHTIDCDELAAKEDRIESWIDLAWRRAANQAASMGRIVATVQHVPGALADVTKIIGESQGNLTNIKTMRRSPTFFDMIIDIEVRDNRHLMSIIAALRASAFVVKVNRTRALPAHLKV
ncbi:guanosine-3',5'-bis(diphosphate) 3'-pyrophosphohydrolase [Litorimonas cladophorae]|uniref:GTP pyrophosphokinase rsh n=1 Tax=Litorimonas cladophorae TaxID=1220491 RepID=A0A918ND59_9PROT|nr:bifunctional (p)ppGpp synthetase/guanosine-3',5'-bis(diphosphate) 3'-pyrophosphohydrolase [Litorimonas cladophorae]GGX59292.1 guanosine-3',5'-bis(diphosphate) 3'-pyrophosphohydrolase [Litorimonas cladophorae]